MEHGKNHHFAASTGTNRGSSPSTDGTNSNGNINKTTSRTMCNNGAKKQKIKRNNNFRHQENIEEQYNSSESDFSGEDNRAVASSTRACDENNENASEDSGYREEDRSREESGSSGDESSNSLGGSNCRRPKPLAPTCNICLIRDDQTTIWCEVTSSIRTRSLNDEMVEFNPTPSSRPKASESDQSKQIDEDGVSPDEQVKELLLCLRPIREGDEKVLEEMRFQPKAGVKGESNSTDINATGSSLAATEKVTEPQHTEMSQTSLINRNGSSTAALTIQTESLGKPPPTAPNTVNPTKRPVKKRPFSCTTTSTSTISNTSSRKKNIYAGANNGNPADSTTATEKSVVESLMLMWNKKSS